MRKTILASYLGLAACGGIHVLLHASSPAIVRRSAVGMVRTSRAGLTPKSRADVNLIVVGGQSRMLGAKSTAITTTSLCPARPNWMLTSAKAFTPLIAVTFEYPWVTAANSFTTLTGGCTSGWRVAVVNCAVGATAIEGLKKGTLPYSNCLADALSVKANATALGLTFQLLGVMWGQGEQNSNDKDRYGYERSVTQLQADLEHDLVLNGLASAPVYFFNDQMASFTTVVPPGVTTSVIPGSALAAAEHSDRIFTVFPGYFEEKGSDHIHPTAYAYVREGEYYARAFKSVVVDGIAWKGTRLRSVSRASGAATVLAVYDVATPPVQWDTARVASATNKGYLWVDDTTSAAITGVTILSSTTSQVATHTATVQITLNQIPIGFHPRLHYAYDGTLGSGAGPFETGSPKGNLRDSDTTASSAGDSTWRATYGADLPNWAMMEDQPVVTIGASDPAVTRPTFSSVSLTPSWDYALLTWSTNVATTGRAEWGVVPANLAQLWLGSGTSQSGSLTSHSLTLTGLAPSTSYVIDERGVAVGGVEGVTATVSFTTPATPARASIPINLQAYSLVVTQAGAAIANGGSIAKDTVLQVSLTAKNTGSQSLTTWGTYHPVGGTKFRYSWSPGTVSATVSMTIPVLSGTKQAGELYVGTLSTLAAGATTALTTSSGVLSWQAVDVGTFTIGGCVDAGDVVYESDESDNCKSQQVVVVP